MNIRLDRTCYACPEQYEAFDENERRVGYLRLRWGEFRVEGPDAGGALVYEATVDHGGMSGIFDFDERDYYLQQAIEAIRAHYATLEITVTQ